MPVTAFNAVAPPLTTTVPLVTLAIFYLEQKQLKIYKPILQI